MNGFLSLKMEENTCLEQHLRIMHEIHHRLVLVWNYEMNGDFAIDGVLRFKNYAGDYVIGRGLITFYEFVSQLRHVKVEPIAREVDNAESIY